MKWNVDFYTFLNTWEGFQKKQSQVSAPHVEALGYHRPVPRGYFLMMHLETFDMSGVIKLVNALRPPWLIPEHGLFELGCSPARRDNWKAKREWELMSLFGKYCKWVLVRKQSSRAAGNASGCCCTTRCTNRSWQSSGASMPRVPHPKGPRGGLLLQPVTHCPFRPKFRCEKEKLQYVPICIIYRFYRQ